MQNNSSRDTVFLHVGTHKTATSAIQLMLESWDELPPNSGIFVPKTGRLSSPVSDGGAGHHGVAWELNDDYRYQPTHGSLRELVDEIESKRFPTVIVSSEDFEYLHQRPEVLVRLRDSFESIGYEVKIVIYLRSRAEYVESVYAESVKHGLAHGFFSFVDKILATGRFKRAHNSELLFEYCKLLGVFEQVFGKESLIVRGYNPNLSTTGIKRDFASIMLGPSTTAFYVGPEKGLTNPTLSLLEVIKQLHSNVLREREVAPGPEELAYYLLRNEDADILKLRFSPIDEIDLLRFRYRFADDDEKLDSRFGISSLSLRSRDERHSLLQRRLLRAVDENWRLS